MLAEAGVGDSDQVLVEFRLVFAFFITANKHNGLLKRVERKSKTPQAVLLKSELLHVREGRAVERIDVRPPEVGTEFSQHFQSSKELVLNFLRKLIKRELIVKAYDPDHGDSAIR